MKKQAVVPVTSLSSSPATTPRERTGGGGGLTRDKGAMQLNPLSARSSNSADSGRRHPPLRSKAVASLAELLSNSLESESDSLSVTTPSESVTSRGTVGSAIGRAGRIDLGGGLANMMMTPRDGGALSESSSVVEGEDIINRSTSTASGGVAGGSRRQSASSAASSSRSSKHARRADEPKGKMASLAAVREPPRRFGGAIVASLDDYDDNDSLVDVPARAARPPKDSRSSSVIEDEEIIEEVVEDDAAAEDAASERDRESDSGGRGRFGNILSLDDYDDSFEEVKPKPAAGKIPEVKAAAPEPGRVVVPAHSKFGIVRGLSDLEDEEDGDEDLIGEDEEAAAEEDEEGEEEVIEEDQDMIRGQEDVIEEDSIVEEDEEVVGRRTSAASEDYIYDEVSSPAQASPLERQGGVERVERGLERASKPLPPFFPARAAVPSATSATPTPAPASPLVGPLAPPPLLSPAPQTETGHHRPAGPRAPSKSVAVQADSALRSAEEDLAAYASRTVFGALGLGHERLRQNSGPPPPPSLDVWASLLDSEPSPIASHVIGPALSGEAPAFLPGLLAANDLYRRYLSMINRFVATSKLQHAQSLEAQGNARSYHYTDLAEVKQYIASNKPRVRSLQEALAEVQQQEI